jgi:hypothetical protein
MDVNFYIQIGLSLMLSGQIAEYPLGAMISSVLVLVSRSNNSGRLGLPSFLAVARRLHKRSSRCCRCLEPAR